ncbi:hypothetical protein ACIO02_24220 [Streptomyces sp. NPDC087568]|uniref:hypothetical protein n=1 Tax=Streptomyces sp. NPDC087568 TaxID=3365799 RepID=UPI0038209A24
MFDTVDLGILRGIFDGPSATCHAAQVSIGTPMDRASCVSLLQPFQDQLDQCFRNAWDRWQEWLKALEGSPADVSPRSRANVLYDFIKAEAVTQFLGIEHVRVRQERGFLVIQIRDRVAIRFKKFRGRKLKTSSIRTDQAMAFQGQALEFANEIEPMTHLVAGYLLDKFELDLEKLAITCTLDGEHIWAPIEIIPDAGQGGVTIPMPMPPTDGPRPVIRSTRKAPAEETSENR